METLTVSKVVALVPRNTGRFAIEVTQDDLCELLGYGQELNHAREAYLRKRDWIRAAIEAGARVEPGLHTAALVDIEGGERISVIKPFKKLVVR